MSRCPYPECEVPDCVLADRAAPTEPTTAPLASGAMTAEEAILIARAAREQLAQRPGFAREWQYEAAALLAVATEAAARARRDVLAELRSVPDEVLRLAVADADVPCSGPCCEDESCIAVGEAVRTALLAAARGEGEVGR
jgi:hypothetical protein